MSPLARGMGDVVAGMVAVSGDIDQYLQGFFTDGLVTVIGLGHSASHGLPTMAGLAASLRAEMPALLTGETEIEEWRLVEQALLDGEHLEPALDAIDHDSPVGDRVVDLAAKAICEAEAAAIRLISEAPRDFALARLMTHLGFNGRAGVITTNYDRLIELAAEIAGLLLETGFLGAHHGIYDVERSHEVLKSALIRRKGGYKVDYRPHVVLSKPHGSLDWYQSSEGPIRSPYPLGLPRLMITPGESKYRHGYDQPFDHHIGVANRLIDRATAILAVGFGFNDPHLQTHLIPRIEKGLPVLILTQNLTSAAEELVKRSSGVIALDRLEPDGGTRVQWDGQVEERPDSDIWQLDNFVSEVLE